MSTGFKDIDEHGATELKAFSVDTFAKRNGISRAQAYKELTAGRLQGRRCGTRVLITERAERAWQDALPIRRKPLARGRPGYTKKPPATSPSSTAEAASRTS
jgi:hypothetical protein